MRDNSFLIISNKDVLFTITTALGEFELSTAVMSSESEFNAAEPHLNSKGNVDGVVFGNTEGGEFTLEMEHWEGRQIFGPARNAGIPWAKVPFTLTAKLPLSEPDSEHGGEVTKYGPERMVVYSSCRVTGNVDIDTATDNTRKLTLPCVYIKKVEVGG